ncbi:MAG TPA: Mu transposase C-terminal domain-containing protein [Ramlibacter sp.]|nr:Mu transposase C-terminal domain-containing protein [Ramlibacter sp.]
MSTWLTARDLAGLPGMPSTEFRTRAKLLKLNIPARARAGRGGGQEFECSALPSETRTALMINQVAQASAVIAAHAEVPAEVCPKVNLPQPVAERRPPSQADKAVGDARVVLVNQLLDLQRLHGTKRAASLMALQLASDQCSDELRATARTANQRARDNSVSPRTLQRWLATYRAEGWWGLLPAQVDNQVTELGDDVAAVLGLYHSKDPQFRNLSDAAKKVTKQLARDYDTWTLLYAKARRALPKLNKVDLIKARHSGSERAALLPHKRRDTSSLKPLDLWLIDGHTFKAKVRHPDHGAPFAPELTAVKDAATRLICGWSVALSENVIAVGDALRHAVGNHGVPALLYSDNGAGETAKQIDCPITGVLARLGTEHRTGIPGNPQARGLIERSWASFAIKCARQFGSYQGSDVDSGTLRKASAELAKEQRALKRAEHTGEVIQLSHKAPSWKQFIDAVDRAVHEYNTQHRHRSLPKHQSGPHAGKHMTPAEAWDAMLDTSLQHKLGELELRMLFMPAMLRTAKRGEVQFLNQVYFSRDLMAVDGEQVRVHYDIHDPSFVMIFTVEGEYVCQAEWNANRTEYFAKPVVDMAREKRVKTALKRLDDKKELALRELQHVQSANVFSLPEPAAPVVLVPDVEGPTSSLSISSPSKEQLVQAAAGRPFFNTASDRYEWLMCNRGEWDAEDGAWVTAYVESDDYAALAEYFTGRGLDWKDGEVGFKSAR